MDNRLPPPHHQNSNSNSNSDKYEFDGSSPAFQFKNTDSRPGPEPKDRKLQKADREKLRRDRLNEQFTELGKTLDPERPKFDKATILGDTIQILNDLTAQVSRLKSEYTALTEESRELTQEKHDLREEKASLKSDIENLNLQYQQRARAMYPWSHMDQSVVMHPPSYTYPVPMQMPMPPGTIPMTPGSIPMHPSIPPYPFFGSQNPGVVSNPCSTFFPSMQYVSPVVQPTTRSHVSSRQGSRSRSSEQGESATGKDGDSNDVATELELKTPGSTGDQDGSPGQSKSKKLHRIENSISDENSPSGCSSSRTVQASSSNSVIGGINADR
uniref:transcription factor bHLH121 n=1 Tax=Erigeron canadensis TaxID=72917 RepID=UPI001CB9310E|nr:transcription factor bHLH121 [Erigeron canadensis]